MSGGSTVGGSDTNVREYFLLGGFLNLSGLAAQSLAGPHFADRARRSTCAASAAAARAYSTCRPTSALSFELGNVWDQRSDISLGSARRDASLFFGADTYIGPVYLAVGYDEGGTTAFYLFLGRSF